MKPIKYQSPKTENIIRRGLIVKEGRKWMSVILIDHPIKVKRVHIDELKYMDYIDAKVSKVKKVLQRMAKSYYGRMTNAPKSVRAALR